MRTIYFYDGLEETPLLNVQHINYIQNFKFANVKHFLSGLYEITNIQATQTGKPIIVTKTIYKYMTKN